jgi:hypothetical protein
MTQFYYGVKDTDHLVNMTRKVVAAFGGGRKALVIMLGTCATETHCAQFPDRHPEKLGVGVGQCDKIALRDVKLHIRPHDRTTLRRLGYDIENVKLSDLADDPLLALCIMRLVYKRKTEPFPSSDDIRGQGEYWKQHYNTSAGAGSAQKYVDDFMLYVPSEFQ